MRHYHITIIHAAGRIVRNVIAHSSCRATQIAVGMMPVLSVVEGPEYPGQFAIICKPGEVKQ